MLANRLLGIVVSGLQTRGKFTHGASQNSLALDLLKQLKTQSTALRFLQEHFEGP